MLNIGVLGFYGKMPSHGDFVERRMTSEFVQVWDAWLQSMMVSTKEALGEKWLDHYLVSPILRFFLCPKVAGNQAWCGILLPSVDSVGRYFPLTFVCPVEKNTDPSMFFEGNASWFDKLENLGRKVLSDQLTAEQVLQELEGVSMPQQVTSSRTIINILTGSESNLKNSYWAAFDKIDGFLASVFSEGLPKKSLYLSMMTGVE